MVKSRTTFSSDDVVVKSPNDRRLYRFIHLDNGLSALLVHDPEIYPDGIPLHSDSVEPSDEEDEESDDEDMEEDSEEEYEDDDDDDDEEEIGEEEEGQGSDDEGKKSKSTVQTKKAAAAMSVEMGSFSDPFEAQGLAHFLEHMLFMGSTGFPDENEYDSYLSKHGGSSNAYTEAEHTCYHFEVKREFLKGALERFSQFFISPLVKTEAMEREVLAVDSEFNQALQNDACRLQQLQCYTSIPGHPFNRFFWGNKKSLVDAMEKGINLQEQIFKLFKDYYHGGLMKLTVIGGEPLDILESWVLELFGDVKKGVQVKPEFEVKDSIWQAGKLYKLEAVKDVHILDLTWTLPCLKHNYLKKPEDYVAHLLGHEGKGSLHFFLKAKGWATSLSAGVGDEEMYRSSIAYVFGMSIYLTDSGLEKIFEIIGYVYQYLKLLRQVSPQEWIFRELQDIGNMEFKFAEEQPQDDYAAELAENLSFYPAEHVIFGDYVHKIWDEDLVKHIIGFFTPENMRVDIVSKSFSKLEDFKIEPWFGSRYAVDDITPFFMDLWRDPSEIDASLHLPAKNEFIPLDFSIRAPKVCDDLPLVSSPRCIIDEPLMKFWYKLDDTFKLPRANTYFRINLSGGYSSVKNCLLTELFVLLLKDNLNEIIYQASIAKLETSVATFGDKLELKVFGFNDKLPILLSKLLTNAKSFMPSEDRFKVIKENMERSLRNTNMKALSHSSYLRLQALCERLYDADEKSNVLNDLSFADLKVIKENMERSLRNINMKPLSHSSYLRLQVLCERFYDADEKSNGLNNLSFVDLKAHIPELLSQLYIEGLCHGNLLEEEAIILSTIFRDNFSVQPLPLEMRHYERIVCFPPGANLVRDVRVKNKLERNSVLELYFQIEPEDGVESSRLKALIDLFDEIIDEPLFNQLRTKEQLGYVVQCSPRVTYRIYGFCFSVQSSEYSPIFLQERVDNFITGLQELLLDLDDDSFENYKTGLIAKLLEKDPSLSYETNRLWNQIVDQRYMFDFSQKEAEELKTIKKNDVIDLYKTYLQESSPKCRRLAIRVWGCEANLNEAETKPKSVVAIRDVEAFKTSSKFYPSLC